MKKLSGRQRGIGWASLLLLFLGCAHVESDKCQITTVGQAQATCCVEDECLTAESDGLSGSFKDIILGFFTFAWL